MPVENQSSYDCKNPFRIDGKSIGKTKGDDKPAKKDA